MQDGWDDDSEEDELGTGGRRYGPSNSEFGSDCSGEAESGHLSEQVADEAGRERESGE